MSRSWSFWIKQIRVMYMGSKLRFISGQICDVSGKEDRDLGNQHWLKASKTGGQVECKDKTGVCCHLNHGRKAQLLLQDMPTSCSSGRMTQANDKMNIATVRGVCPFRFPQIFFMNFNMLLNSVSFMSNISLIL